MSFWDGLFGGRRRADDAKDFAMGQINQGVNDSRNALSGGYNEAKGYLNPWAIDGRRAAGRYQDFLGLNGGERQGAAQAGYQQFNPYHAATDARQLQAVDRRAAATGNMGSGLAALARGRVVDETASRDYQDYLARLLGISNTGFGASNALSGLAANQGRDESGLITNAANARAQVGTQYNNALAGADRSGAQNMLNIAALAGQAFAGLAGGGGAGGAQVPVGTSQAAGGGNNNFLARLLAGFGG